MILFLLPLSLCIVQCFRHGAEIVDTSGPLSNKKKGTFSGIGYRLGQSSNDSEGM